MADWLENLSNWWHSLSARDQLILKIATPVILLVLVFVLLVEPVMKQYFARKAEYQEARETLDWLYNQAGLISRLQNDCGKGVFYMQPQDDPMYYARSLARRSSVNAEYSDRGESVFINIKSAVGNRTLKFIQTLACNGYEVDELKIIRLPEKPESVSATMRIVPRALPRSQ